MALHVVDDGDYGWNEPSDLATDRGRYTVSISFDMDPGLDDIFYAQVVATRALRIIKERALVRSAVLEDLFADCELTQ